MNKKNNSGCLSGLIGTLAVMIAVVIFAIFSSLINKLLISKRFGDNTDCALLPLSLVIIAVAFVLFEAIFIAWEIRLGKKGASDEQKFKRIFKMTALISISLALVLPMISAFTYTRLSEDRISKVCFFEYGSYELDSDMTNCTLACNSDGKLTFTVSMSDGERIELLGTVNSCGTGFVEKYENLYGYAAHLTKLLREKGLYPTVIGKENMEIYKDTHPEIWIYLEKMIQDAEDLGNN